MEILSAVANLIRDLAWPVVVFLVLRRFETSVVELLKRLIEVRLPAKVNLKFENPKRIIEALQRGNRNAAPPLVKITEPLERIVVATAPVKMLTDRQNAPIAVVEEPSAVIPYSTEDAPILAIQIAWTLLSERLISTAKEEGGKPGRSPVTAAEHLAKLLPLSSHFSATVIKLQLLLKHYRCNVPTREEANGFIDACNVVLDSLVQPDHPSIR